MEAKDLQSWGAIILAFIAILGHLKGYFSSGEKSISDKVSKLETKLDGLETRIESHASRIQSIEGELRHLPDREAFHRLELKMADLTGQLSTMTERLKPMEAIGERLQELLLERAK